jgi:hypothetical protein
MKIIDEEMTVEMAIKVMQKLKTHSTPIENDWRHQRYETVQLSNGYYWWSENDVGYNCIKRNNY